MDIDEIEALSSDCDEEVSREAYLVASGQQAVANTAAIYAKYDNLFTLENIRRVQQALTTHGMRGIRRERTRLARIALLLISIYVEARVAPLRDTLETRKHSLSVPTPDGPVPYLRAGELAASHPDPATRRAVWQVHGDTTLAELAPTALQLWQARQQVARELGYRSYAAMFARLKGIDLRQLAHDTELVLAATEAPHRAAMATALRTYAGVPLQEATSADFR